MAKIKAEKSPFDIVPEEFKDAIAAMDVNNIKQRIAQVALDQVELMKLKKEDQDLEERKIAYREAGEMYKAGSKVNRVKIEYCKAMIDNKGG